jgi:predicted dehydrogenase
MWDGLRLNGEKYGKLFITKPGLDAAGVDFYDGNAASPADLEAKMWIDCIINDTEPMVKPEEALVVTEILEAIYESGKTGKAVYLK